MMTEVLGFTLYNSEKVERAINGVQRADGTFVGGVADKDGNYDDGALLAEYDRLGGLIKRGTDRVQTGSFYDFKARRPRPEPAVVFEYNVNGKKVLVKADEEVPGIVKAARQLADEEARAEEAPKKVKRAKK